MPDALQRIRAELGKDAVILNTKEVKTGGFFGLFGKKRIEVIAAIDAAPAPSVQPPLSPGRTAGTAGRAVPSTRADGPLSASWPAASEAPPVPPKTPPAPVFPEPAPQRTPPVPYDSLMEEVRQVKEMVRRMTVHTGASLLPEAFQPIERRLLEQDVDPSITAMLLANAMNGREDGDWSEAEARAAVRSAMIDLMRAGGRQTLESDTRIAHFVGPTGVGKTTTIAKLAAEQVLKYNRKVGFITSDTYRIAAVEQLKTYANILNVPLEVVFSPQELARAFKQLEDRDVIFMDTAGRNFRNEMYVSELNALLGGNANSETYLVLSLTSKYRDMKATVENFLKFKLDKVLYTKLDETESLGSILNIAYHYALKGSYITTGQNVPDDISVMNEERIVDLILGGGEDA